MPIKAAKDSIKYSEIEYSNLGFAKTINIAVEKGKTSFERFIIKYFVRPKILPVMRLPVSDKIKIEKAVIAIIFGKIRTDKVAASKTYERHLIFSGKINFVIS